MRTVPWTHPFVHPSASFSRGTAVEASHSFIQCLEWVGFYLLCASSCCFNSALTPEGLQFMFTCTGMPHLFACWLICLIILSSQNKACFILCVTKCIIAPLSSNREPLHSFFGLRFCQQNTCCMHCAFRHVVVLECVFSRSFRALLHSLTPIFILLSRYMPWYWEEQFFPQNISKNEGRLPGVIFQKVVDVYLLQYTATSNCALWRYVREWRSGSTHS